MAKDLPRRMFGKKYLAAVNMLYGKTKIEDAIKTKISLPAKNLSVPTKTKIPTEMHEQIKFCDWLDQQGMLYFAVPNGGSRSIRTGALLRRSGMRAGVPDLFICMPYLDKAGLFIEMKRTIGGKLTREQIEWGDRLMDKGYAWYVAHGAQEAIGQVKTYFCMD